MKKIFEKCLLQTQPVKILVRTPKQDFFYLRKARLHTMKIENKIWDTKIITMK